MDDWRWQVQPPDSKYDATIETVQRTLVSSEVAGDLPSAESALMGSPGLEQFGKITTLTAAPPVLNHGPMF
ncbi:MAG: hypothetical protein WCA20_31315 [Candidatus Sulfotelmatobacter sp.]